MVLESMVARVDAFIFTASVFAGLWYLHFRRLECKNLITELTAPLIWNYLGSHPKVSPSDRNG